MAPQPSPAATHSTLVDRASPVRKLAVRLARQVLASFSLEIRRISPRGTATGTDPAPLCDDFVEALYRERGGEPGAFLCQTSRCVYVTGFSLAPAAWHPFRETLREFLESTHEGYQRSILERFYTAWRPGTAGQAFPGFASVPEEFHRLPPACVHLSPWMAWAPARTESSVNAWNVRDWKEHGAGHLEPRKDGLPLFGPVSPKLGAFEYARLINLVAALNRLGFQRDRGDVRVQVLKRGDDFRFLHLGGGHHRTVAMNVLGHEVIPARHNKPWVIDVDQAADWPGVRSGLWTEVQARAYVDYLFEFDSQAWANSLGLTGSPRSGHAQRSKPESSRENRPSDPPLSRDGTP
jgi:hypothetical protein